MKLLVLLLGLLPLALPVAGFAAAQRAESVLIFESRKVSVAIPPGFTVQRGVDEAGLVNLHLANAGQQVSLQLAFVPDANGRIAAPRARKERMVELFEPYVAGSVEQAMRFEELEPRQGAGTYCVFTDSSLVGKTELPTGEYRHLTVGLKSWPGVMVIFRLFSQDTNGADYLAALRLLRASVEERPVPLR